MLFPNNKFTRQPSCQTTSAIIASFLSIYRTMTTALSKRYRLTKRELAGSSSCTRNTANDNQVGLKFPKASTTWEIFTPPCSGRIFKLTSACQQENSWQAANQLSTSLDFSMAPLAWRSVAKRFRYRSRHTKLFQAANILSKIHERAPVTGRVRDRQSRQPCGRTQPAMLAAAPE
jgi:hypothetical protein